MTQDASGEYLRSAVMTATPEQLQLMLYDGAVRFAGQARAAMVEGDWEASCEKLIRAQRIVLEMRSGLRREVNPSLCDNLASLYDFIYGRLVDANMKRDPAAIDEALRILHHQRETWQMLIDKTRGAAPDDTRPASSDASATPQSGVSLSVEG
ncbi:MAG: flagellar export chaperone FliS [Phycisphaerae bacterium]